VGDGAAPAVRPRLPRRRVRPARRCASSRGRRRRPRRGRPAVRDRPRRRRRPGEGAPQTMPPASSGRRAGNERRTSSGSSGAASTTRPPSRARSSTAPSTSRASGTPDAKAEALEAFQDGEIRVLVTKPSIAGFGMNFQNASRMAFVGLGDSYEAYYQAIRRCWRFGQTEPVDAHVVVSELEQQIVANVQRKEREARAMTALARPHMRRLGGSSMTRRLRHRRRPRRRLALMLGDSCERLAELDDESVDLSVFSPPFASLYTYSRRRATSATARAATSSSSTTASSSATCCGSPSPAGSRASTSSNSRRRRPRTASSA
jgi:hypothetical protein